MKPEAIILRHFVHHVTEDKDDIEVFYPEEEANPGFIVCQTIHEAHGPVPTIEATTEGSIGYYLRSCAPLKDKELSEKLKDTLEHVYQQKFVVRQRIGRKKN